MKSEKYFSLIPEKNLRVSKVFRILQDRTADFMPVYFSDFTA